MLFLQTAYTSLVSGCKDTNIIRYMATFVLCFIICGYISICCVQRPSTMRGVLSFVFARWTTTTDLFTGENTGRCVHPPLWSLSFSVSYTLFILQNKQRKSEEVRWELWGGFVCGAEGLIVTLWGRLSGNYGIVHIFGSSDKCVGEETVRVTPLPDLEHGQKHLSVCSAV